MTRLVGVFLVVAGLLTGCSVFGAAPSPTTTYTDTQGQQITVDWVDYPADAGVDGEVLLGRADQTGLEPEARELVGDLRAAITDASGLAMASTEAEREWFKSENWFPSGGNGYGGESLLITLNCCDLTTNAAPGRAQWQSVLDAASEVTVAAGLGPLVLEQDSPAMRADPEWSQSYLDQYCNLEGGECWVWRASVYDGVQWVSFTIENVALDPTGVAATEAEKFDRPLDSIMFSYGATVVRSGKSDEYARAIQPFLGLVQPASTTSD